MERRSAEELYRHIQSNLYLGVLAASLPAGSGGSLVQAKTGENGFFFTGADIASL